MRQGPFKPITFKQDFCNFFLRFLPKIRDDELMVGTDSPCSFRFSLRLPMAANNAFPFHPRPNPKKNLSSFVRPPELIHIVNYLQAKKCVD